MADDNSTISERCCLRSTCQQKGKCHHRKACSVDVVTRNRRMRSGRINQGLCATCGKSPFITGHTKCDNCLQTGRKLYRIRVGPPREPRPHEDLTGQVFGSWEIIRLKSHSSSGWIWLTRCTNCSMERECTTSNIKARRRTCKRCFMRPRGWSGLNRLFRTYKRHAKVTGRMFWLTFDDFKTLTAANCFYCGTSPYQLSMPRSKRAKYDWGEHHYNGIDRADNTQDYTPGNCVTCCGICNRAKQSMTQGDFIAYIRRLSQNAVTNSIPCLSQHAS